MKSGWAASLGFAGVWIAAAAVADGTTFHLAPVIVAGAAPLAGSARRRLETATGTAIAAAVTLGLLAAGRLEGPSILPWGDAALESLLGAAAGGIAGFLLAGISGREKTTSA